MSGRGKKNLLAATTFHIEHALENSNVTVQCQSRVTTNHKTKSNSLDTLEQLWQTHDNQGIILFETLDGSYF